MNKPAKLGAEVLDRIRRRLATRIDEVGISVAKLARRSGISARTIHRVLKEPERDVYVSTVAALCVVLKIDMSELLVPLPEETAQKPEEPTPGESKLEEG